MLKHRFYYALKPYMPWGMRMALRRITARHTRKSFKSTWPIDESAGRTPENWKGWPENKNFAFVLTHDVEGPDGLAKCRQLAELEIAAGVRSCFNFIPEGPYTVPPSLRTWLTDNGFEVGVHDLHHDGRLFSSKRGFERKSVRINRYFKSWQATGFRAAFMLRQLDWMQSLEVGYDSSTFDTDPFEPQSQGAGTIFPFRVPPARLTSAGGSEVPSKGYIEIPYTLAQDSTLFLVLGEKSPDIWLRKLDWIVSRGGMALVNVHPDYIQFEGDPTNPRTYPVAYYRQLLSYVRQQYDNQYWHALPKDLARYVDANQPPAAMHMRRRVGMITHSFYESDNRVTRYAEALAARGDHVDVFALRSNSETPSEESIAGVRVLRIQDRFGKSQRTKFAYIWPLIRFLFISSAHVTRAHSRQRYDLLHIHNMPDFLVYAAWYPKFDNVKIILDIHDIVPEFYHSKFSSGNNGGAFALLKFMERRSAQFADQIIISNHLWSDKYADRTGTRDRCSVFINNVDAKTFQPQVRTRKDGKLIILFPGGLQWHQGLDIALHAFVKVSQTIPQAEFHIYGDGIMKPSLVALAKELGFDGKVKFFPPVRITAIAHIMADADLGIVPKRADSFGNEAYSTKIMEFMSLGVPVVVSKTKIDQFYFNDSVVRFFASGDADALAVAMLDVINNQELRNRLVTNALEYSNINSWSSRKADYLQLVDQLVKQNRDGIASD